MALNIGSIVTELETATILELNELVETIEKKFNVSAATPITVVEPAAGGAAEEQTELTAELTAAGDQKVRVIKAIRETTDLGLKEAKAIVGGAPAPVKEGISKKEAGILKATLEEVDASVTVEQSIH